MKEGDIKVGDFVTVVKWISHKDNSYVGHCLEVAISEYPFIRVIDHDCHWMRGRPLTLKIGDVEIMPLSKEFVASVMENKTHA